MPNISDPRKSRVKTHDPEWTVAAVSPLKALCLQYIVNNFAESPILNELEPEDKAYVVKNLPTSLPLNISANLIHDEGYWKRCCEACWSLCDVSEYGGSWKSMYFERHLENIITLFIPGMTDPKTVLDFVPFCQNYVRRLKICQLLPPIKELPKSEEDASDSASDLGSEGSTDHFDFRILLDKLTSLRELNLVYAVKGCGMNFEWNMFEITFRDCELLAMALKSCKSLKILRLQSSNVDAAKCRVLIKGLVDHPLQELDLSHNILADGGAKAIASLLGQSRLQRLTLYDNHIHGPGCQAIANALSKNDSLLHLNLRLNPIDDEGGQAIAEALQTNQTLETLDLGVNEMTDPTAMALAGALVKNTALRKLNLSCNKLGLDGVKALKEAMCISSLLECDVRGTDIGLENEAIISKVIHTTKAKGRNQPSSHHRASMVAT